MVEELCEGLGFGECPYGVRGGELPLDTDAGGVATDGPVVGEAFAEEGDVAWFEGADVVTDETCAASGCEQGELHG